MHFINFQLFMSANYFEFKKFKIVQADLGMRLSTDSVLLGASVYSNCPKNILDIGSGTGILSLMMAQRYNDAKITAIDIEKAAFETTKLNVENSKWKARINVVQADIKKWKSEQKYDLIICNPPYFEHDTPSPIVEKQIARQNSLLSYEELAFYSSRLMAENSDFWCILPYDKQQKLISAFLKQNISPFYFMPIKSQPHKPYIRIILGFSAKIKRPVLKNLCIYDTNKEYCQDFANLTKDFYKFF